MKILMVFLIAGLCLVAQLGAQPPTEITPAISLFDSADAVKAFLANSAKQDYSDKFLSGIAWHYFEGHPKAGPAWVYTFAFKKPRHGGNISIYHYMDGEIVEFLHGP
ncbi:MAG TPA: hypothetical protein PLG04_06560 [Anaerolineaceae bacterium]|nr:hypothetical protein [Anaerolineaceae bacterium]